MKISNLNFMGLKAKTKLCAIAMAGIITIMPAVLTGCKQMDCNISYSHAHEYVNKDGFIKPEKSENETDGDYRWTDETVAMTDEIEAENRFDLLSIEENKNVLTNIMTTNCPHIEYEYAYKYHYWTGSCFMYLTGYAWTTDRSLSGITLNGGELDSLELTGTASNVSYKYYSYAIKTKGNGNIVVEKSDGIDNIFELKDTYSYFKTKDFVLKVYGPIFTYQEDKTIKK